MSDHLNYFKLSEDDECINVVYGNLLERPCYFHRQVYSERYVDQMGIIGYFPATVLKETQKFTENLVKIPTTVSVFVSFIRLYVE